MRTITLNVESDDVTKLRAAAEQLSIEGYEHGLGGFIERVETTIGDAVEREKKNDARYSMPVNNMSSSTLAAQMPRALDAASQYFPKKTGVILMAFDFGAGGGLAYVSNGNRADCIALLEEWIRHQRRLA